MVTLSVERDDMGFEMAKTQSLPGFRSVEATSGQRAKSARLTRAERQIMEGKSSEMVELVRRICEAFPGSRVVS